LISKVEKHPKITLHLKTKPLQITGHVGNFKTRVEEAGKEQTIAHGVIVLAVGGSERQTDLYLNGKHPGVMTQRQLEDKLADKAITSEALSVVMIQCADSRNDKHPYCSRVCCSAAIKNALELKKQKPNAKVVVLYKDIRTYGFRELGYQQAREAGVLFIRYNDKQDPVVSDKGGLHVSVVDGSNGKEITLKPDFVVLSTRYRAGRGQSNSVWASPHGRSPRMVSSWKPTPSCAPWIWPTKGEFIAVWPTRRASSTRPSPTPRPSPVVPLPCCRTPSATSPAKSPRSTPPTVWPVPPA